VELARGSRGGERDGEGESVGGEDRLRARERAGDRGRDPRRERDGEPRVERERGGEGERRRAVAVRGKKAGRGRDARRERGRGERGARELAAPRVVGAVDAAIAAKPATTHGHSAPGSSRAANVQGSASTPRWTPPWTPSLASGRRSHQRAPSPQSAATPSAASAHDSRARPPARRLATASAVVSAETHISRTARGSSAANGRAPDRVDARVRAIPAPAATTARARL
jgi:hypothetical protein